MYYYLEKKQTKVPDEGVTQHYDVMKEMGDCYASVGDYTRARQCYEKAVRLMPDEAGPYVGLGVVAFQQGRKDLAEDYFRKAARLDASNSRALCGLGMVLQDDGAYEESFDMYLTSLEHDPDNLTALLGLFQVSCRMGTFARVIDYLNQYLERHPADAAVLLCLATLHLRDGRLVKARQLLRDIQVIEPENSDAANLLEEVDRAIEEARQLKCEPAL